jgi:hypothetical protein
MTDTNNTDALLAKINKAVAEANEAEKAHEKTHAELVKTHAELVSKSKIVGQLLLEAKELHPAKKDFKAFLQRVNGLHISRAYDLLRLAGGRITDEELRQDAKERQRKSRAKRKLPKPQPESVTDPPVTDSRKRITQSPEISAEQRRAENARLDHDDNQVTSAAIAASARALAEFTVACRHWLPKITVETDRQKACLLVSELTSNKQAEAA